MAVTRVPSGPARKLVNPIPKPSPVGVKEAGYRDQLKFDSKVRPAPAVNDPNSGRYAPTDTGK